MLAERARNQLAKSLLPIACKQSRLVAEQSGARYEDLEGEAMKAIALAMRNGCHDRPGFYSFVKSYVKGYLYNWLRDSYRSVRLPRDISLAYLAEQRQLKNNRAEYSKLTDGQKAELCGCSLEDLLDSRSAIALHSKELDGFDGDFSDTVVDFASSDSADLVEQVISLGIRSMASKTKISQDELTESFYAALRQVLEARDAN